MNGAGDLARRATTAAVWSGAQTLVSRGILVAVFLVLARVVSPEDFGIVAIGLALVAVCQTLLDQGLSVALVQRDDLKAGHCDAVFWTNAGLGVLLAGGLVGLSGPLAGFFDVGDLGPVVSALAATLVIDSLGLVPVALLTRDLNFKSLALRTTVAGFVSGVVAVAAALAGAGMWALVLQAITLSLVSLVTVWMTTTWRPSLRPQWRFLRDLLPLATPVFGTNLLVAIYRRTDDLIIGKVLGAGSLGLYTIAYRLLQLFNEALLSSLSRVTLPAFSRAQDDPSRVLRGLLRATAVSSALAFPAFVGLAVFAPELVSVSFGSAWSESGTVLALLAPIGIVHSLAYLYSDVLLAVGRAGTRFLLWLVRCLLHVAGFIIGVRWGINGVAIGFTLTGWMMLPVDLVVLRRVLGLDLRQYWQAVRCQTAGSAALLAVGVGFKTLLPTVHPWVTLTLGGAIALAAFVLVTLSLNSGLRAELRGLGRRRGSTTAKSPA